MYLIILLRGVNLLFKKHTMIITVATVILLCAVLFFYMTGAVSSGRLAGTPTVFVHGYKGTYYSFAAMLQRFENNYGWGEKVLVYHVSKNGKLKVEKIGDQDAQPAYVQVVFENNRASFEDSAGWLAAVLSHLKKHYHVNKAHVVGHSMGGIISLKYIEDYQDDTKYPQIDKLVTLGSPFDGIYNKEYFQLNRDAAAVDLMPDSPALNILRKNKEAFPNNIDVLSIGSTGDIVAEPESVQSIRDIVSHERLKQIIIQNRALGHSALHENQEVDALIHDFLY